MAFTAQPGQSYSLDQLTAAGGVPVANNSNANDLYANYVKNNVPGAFLPQSNQPNPVISTVEKAGNGLENFGKSVMGDINNDTADITKQIQTPIANTQGPIDPATGLPQSNLGKGAVEKGFGIVGDALDAITSPIQEALKGTLGPVTNALSNLGADKQTKANAQQVQAQISQYLQAHPELSQNLTTLNKIISSAGVIAGTDEAGQGLENAQDRINNPQLDSGTLQNIASGAKPTAPETPETAPSGAKTGDSLKGAQEAVKMPASPTETKIADAEGRTSMVNGKKVISTPTSEDAAMHKALQPLVENGKITTNRDPLTGLIKPEEQASNIANTRDEISNQTNNLRTQAQASDKITGDEHDEEYGQQLKDKVDQLQRPTTIKSDSALQKRLDDFDDAVKEKIDETTNKVDEKSGQTGSGRIEGLLNDRQVVRQMMEQELPKAWENKTRADTALESHAKDVYNLFNQEAVDNLPNGKLPDGTDWTKTGKTQSALIDAQDELARKYATEYPEGKGELSRIFKAHPLLGKLTNILTRQVARLPIQIGEGEAGITELVRQSSKPK